MARTKVFDPEHAVDAAMRAFWASGYGGTSVDDLTRACGIGRGSMYATFGSKDALYLRALERYQRVEGEAAFSCLDGPGTAPERLGRLFARFADDALDDPENRGCFVLNAAMERAPHDPEVAWRIRAGLKAFEQVLTDLVADGQSRGELPGEREPRALARYLISALNGVRVTAKATRDRALVADAVRVALGPVGG